VDDLNEYIAGCLETLERKRHELALNELIVKLRAAEQEGRAEDVRRLNAQVNDLRMRKAGVQHAPTV
jgi:DNA primase